MSGQKFPVELSAEALDIMSAGGTNTSVLASAPWRLFTKVYNAGPVNDKDGIVGTIHAQGVVDPENPIFGWHFAGRPLLPGVLLQDQLLQLAGVYAMVCGITGDGVARVSGKAKFMVPVTPKTRELIFEVDIIRTRLTRGITTADAEGRVLADGEVAVKVSEMMIAVKHHVES